MASIVLMRTYPLIADVLYQVKYKDIFFKAAKFNFK